MTMCHKTSFKTHSLRSILHYGSVARWGCTMERHSVRCMFIITLALMSRPGCRSDAVRSLHRGWPPLFLQQHLNWRLPSPDLRSVETSREVLSTQFSLHDTRMRRTQSAPWGVLGLLAWLYFSHTLDNTLLTATTGRVNFPRVEINCWLHSWWCPSVNSFKFQIQVSSFNYRGCWHQTCPPMDPR